MRLTIEPTMNSDSPECGARYPTAMISVNSDDLNLDEVIEELFAPLMVAAGYGPHDVQRRLLPPE